MSLGQNQEFPQNQDLGHHGPGAIEEDEAVQARGAYEIPISYL
jgi:hypothetical protein